MAIPSDDAVTSVALTELSERQRERALERYKKLRPAGRVRSCGFQFMLPGVLESGLADQAGFHEKPGQIVDFGLPAQRLRFQPFQHLGVKIERHCHPCGRRRGV